MISTLSPQQYRTLVAIRDGQPHTLYPMMRKSFIRSGLIVAAGPAPSASDARRRQAPSRPFALTELGRVTLEQQPDPGEAPRWGCGPLKMEFGRQP